MALQEMQMTNNRYVYAAAATVVLLLAGVIYAWSILNVPFQQEFNWSQGALGLNFTLTMGAFCAGLILGGVLIKRVPFRRLVIAAGALVCVGFVVTGRISGNSILVLYVFYAVFGGLGIGMVYNVLISSVMGWFPDKRATISGVLMMGFGASTLVFGLVANALMDAVGWRNMYLGIGVTILAVFTVCSFVIKPYAPLLSPAGKADKDEGAKNAAANEKKETPAANETDTKQLLRLPVFWRFYGFETLIAAVGACVIAMARDMAVYVGTTEALAVMLVGVSSVSNGFGRIFAGILFDKKGNIVTMRTVGALAALTPVFMLLASITGLPGLFIPGIILAGFSYGFTPVLASGYMGKNFGMKNFPLNFSVTSTFLFAASFSAAIGGWLHGFTGGFNAVFVFMAGIGILAMILAEGIK